MASKSDSIFVLSTRESMSLWCKRCLDIHRYLGTKPCKNGRGINVRSSPLAAVTIRSAKLGPTERVPQRPTSAQARRVRGRHDARRSLTSISTRYYSNLPEFWPINNDNTPELRDDSTEAQQMQIR